MMTDNQQNWVFRQSTIADKPRIWEIILQAKKQMRDAESIQWQDGYPSLEDIEHDIADGSGYVICIENKVIAFGAVSFEGEPAYDELLGEWIGHRRYVVIHRIAIANEMKHKGVASFFFECAERHAISNGILSFRVDTNFDNYYMLKLLKKSGFVYCGEVHYGKRGSRQAFEKLLDKNRK
jgi:GNAT superfamily N-acetyltransferase